MSYRPKGDILFMKNIIDARGLACPQPVILTKKALEQEDCITVIVDNEAAVENVSRMGIKSGCIVDKLKKEDGTFHLKLTKKEGGGSTEQSSVTPVDYTCTVAAGPLVVSISAARMGRGEDEQGSILMRSFIHTLMSLAPLPHTLIFYNAGVKLAIRNSEVLDDLKEIEASGVSIIVCGTCLNFFGLTGDLAVGVVSNMYDIASTMAAAGKLVSP
jgi:selenium metabolism protein YedF